jgi:acyl-CoA hydrolase
MNLRFATNFTVMPMQTNYNYPMIFGGAFFAEIDLCAAQCVNRLLHDSPTCRTCVTHKAEVTFHKPCYAGDLIFLEAEVAELRHKAVKVLVKAFRERCGSSTRDFVAESTFVFVTVSDVKNVQDKPDLLPYAHHKLEMPDETTPK